MSSKACATEGSSSQANVTSAGGAGKQEWSLHRLGRGLDSVRGRKHWFFSEGSSTAWAAERLRLADGSGAGNAALDPTTATRRRGGGPWGSLEGRQRCALRSASSRKRLTPLGGAPRSDAVLEAVDIGGMRPDGKVAPGPNAAAPSSRGFRLRRRLVRNATIRRRARQGATARRSYICSVYSPKYRRSGSLQTSSRGGEVPGPSDGANRVLRSRVLQR